MTLPEGIRNMFLYAPIFFLTIDPLRKSIGGEIETVLLFSPPLHLPSTDPSVAEMESGSSGSPCRRGKKQKKTATRGK